MSIHKQQVADRFAKAQQSYVEHAIVQKDICQKLIAFMQEFQLPTGYSHVLEIGCGSGNLTQLIHQNFSFHHYVLNDLYQSQALAQLDQAQFSWLLGDIEQLELPKHLSLVVSSSALQWVENLPLLIENIVQALSSQAYFCFSTFGEQNLKQFKALTGQGLSYFSKQDLAQLLQKAGFEILCLEEELQTLYFEHPKQVLQHLKATGVTATSTVFRWTKKSLQAFYQDYQPCRGEGENGLYPLTYHPIYCIARKLK